MTLPSWKILSGTQVGSLPLMAETQVGVPDNAGAQPALAELSARAHRRRAVDEFDFADRLHRRRAVGAIHRAAFDKDCFVML